MDLNIIEYRNQIIAAWPNKKGNSHFLEKGFDENHERLLKKAKNLINCSHLGMVCLKGCPRAQETERPVIKDGSLSNDMALLTGKVLYEVTNTSDKSMLKYDRELAKLMVPTRRSPSGPVKGTKSSQPPTKKNVQQPSPKPKKRENMRSKGNRRYANSESSEGKFPSVTKCDNCFISHFPNKKFCRWSTLETTRKETKIKHKADILLDETMVSLILSHITLIETISKSKLLRLRGGAGENELTRPVMISQAIENMELL